MPTKRTPRVWLNPNRSLLPHRNNQYYAHVRSSQQHWCCKTRFMAPTYFDHLHRKEWACCSSYLLPIDIARRRRKQPNPDRANNRSRRSSAHLHVVVIDAFLPLRLFAQKGQRSGLCPTRIRRTTASPPTTTVLRYLIVAKDVFPWRTTVKGKQFLSFPISQQKHIITRFPRAMPRFSVSDYWTAPRLVQSRWIKVPIEVREDI